MKTMFLENGENKTIDKLSDLPEMTTHLLEVNLKITREKNVDRNNFGMPSLIIFMFFIKFLSKQGLSKKTYLLLWKMCEDFKLIEDLYNIESCKGYILLRRQSEIKEKLRLINSVNLTLSVIPWFDRFIIKNKIKKFYKKVNPLIYDNDTKGNRSHNFGHALAHLGYIFEKEFKISNQKVIESIIVNK